MDHRWLFAIIGLVFLGVGCATAMYQGDKKPDNEVATIKTDGTKVEKIDGRAPASAISRKFKVLPGEHSIALFLDDSPEHSPYGSRYRYTQASLTVCITARAGHTYVASPSYIGRQWSPEFFDEDTTQKITTRPYDAKLGGCQARIASTVTTPAEPEVGQDAPAKIEEEVVPSPPQVTQADLEKLRASRPPPPAETQPGPPRVWLGVRGGFAFGGDNLITGTMGDGSTRTLDAGKGGILTFNGSTAPWWISNSVGFGFGIEFGLKYGGISASNGSASLMRYPLVAFLQVLARLSDRAYLLARGGIDKDLSVSLSGDGILADAKADFTSNVGWMGEVGGGYHYTNHMFFDLAFRYTRVRYSLPGGSLDGSNGGLMMGMSYMF